MKRVLLVPSVKKSWGTGHLKRCLRLLRTLGPEARLLVPSGGSAETWGFDEVRSLLPAPLSPGLLVDGPGDGPWDLVVFDRRMTSPEEFVSLGAGNPTLGLDEGGAVRRCFSYLIDAFPRLSRDVPPNFFSEGLAAEGPGPASLRRPKKIRRVVLSFGGEDPAGLTETTYSALTASGIIQPEDIDVVIGPFFTRPFNRPCGKTITGRAEIRTIFSEYDAVFTSYGITPYEVMKEGGAPILVNPTEYHERLSRKAGFPSLGMRKISAGRLRKWMENPERYLYPLYVLKKLENTNLTGIINSLSREGYAVCPVCGPGRCLSVWRTADKTYFMCPSCGLVYLQNFSDGKIRYDRDYFFEEYRKQYGKTYLEDFETIKKAARERLRILSRCGMPIEDKSLLDVGCAYGPFLAAARERGLKPRGLDVSEDAVRYVRQNLNIPSAAGDFVSFQPDAVFGVSAFDIVTLWYVIEHFTDLGGAVKKLAALTRPGGLLAFATPNRRGVTGRFFPDRFYRQSPRDHYTVWDTKSAKRVLSVYGFEIRKIRVTGHHPERFPEFFKRVFGLYLCGVLSRLFGLGDTFEVYAYKK